MAKAKKISVSAFENVMKQVQNIDEFEWNGLTISVTKTIGAKEAIGFAKAVVAESFHAETGEYIPYLKEYSIRRCIIEAYSNLSLPDSVERQYDILYRTDIVDEVMSHINTAQLRDIIDSANDKIENVATSNAERVNQMAADVANTISLLEEKLEVFNNMMSQADIKAMVDLVTPGKVDESSIAKSIIEFRNKNSGGSK